MPSCRYENSTLRLDGPRYRLLWVFEPTNDLALEHVEIEKGREISRVLRVKGSNDDTP